MDEKNENRLTDGSRELRDDELDSVTGGLFYWSSVSEGDAFNCPKGGAHNWVLSPTGSFEYCTKCNSERYPKK